MLRKRICFFFIFLFCCQAKVWAASYDEQLNQLRNIVALQQAEIMQLKKMVLNGTGPTGGGSTDNGSSNTTEGAALVDCIKANNNLVSSCGTQLNAACAKETSVTRSNTEFDRIDCSSCVKAVLGFQSPEYNKCKQCVISAPAGQKDYLEATTKECMK